MARQLAREMWNPLALIGGLARRITKKSLTQEELKEHAGRISEGITRVESVVDKISASLQSGVEQRNHSQ